jgi:hypothetical protein
MDAFLSAMRAVADFAIEVLLLIALIFLSNSLALRNCFGGLPVYQSLLGHTAQGARWPKLISERKASEGKFIASPLQICCWRRK